MAKAQADNMAVPRTKWTAEVTTFTTAFLQFDGTLSR
jgi:hypothetical protein